MTTTDDNSKIDESWDEESEASDDGAEATSEQDGETPSAEGSEARRKRRRKPKAPDWMPEDDERAVRALEFVQGVLREMSFDCRARLKQPSPEEENPEIKIEILGNDTARIIGKKGQVLGALQFLAHRVINRPGLERRHVLVDAEGYRNRRDDSLATMARRLGQQAVELGKVITFEPMNPRDRRVVHLALAKFEGVITRSDGEGDDRRVQIIPVRRSVTP